MVDKVPFSKSPYKWDRSIKIFSEDPGDEDLGSYSSETREIRIEPTQSFESKVTSISHEISHSRLGHKNPKVTTLEDLKIKLRGVILSTEGGFKDIKRYEGWALSLYELLTEFEVRIYQKVKGYLRQYGDTFSDYLENRLREESSLGQRLIIGRVALQSITNLVKKGILNKKEAKVYRKVVYNTAKRFKIRGFS